MVSDKKQWQMGKSERCPEPRRTFTSWWMMGGSASTCRYSRPRATSDATAKRSCAVSGGASEVGARRLLSEPPAIHSKTRHFFAAASPPRQKPSSSTMLRWRYLANTSSSLRKEPSPTNCCARSATSAAPAAPGLSTLMATSRPSASRPRYTKPNAPSSIFWRGAKPPVAAAICSNVYTCGSRLRRSAVTRAPRAVVAPSVPCCAPPSCCM